MTTRVVHSANLTPLLTNLSQTQKTLLQLLQQPRQFCWQEKRFSNFMGKKKSEAECQTRPSSYLPASVLQGRLKDDKSASSFLTGAANRRSHSRSEKGAITELYQYISASLSLSAGIFLPTAESATHPRKRNDKVPRNRKANASLLPVDHTSWRLHVSRW